MLILTAVSKDVPPCNCLPLKVGRAFFLEHDKLDGGRWRSMRDAPRDGTLIEIKNIFGVVPTYSLAKWTDKDVARGTVDYIHPGTSAALTVNLDGSPVETDSVTMDEPEWKRVPDGGGYIEETHLLWRWYGGTVESYLDPTAGVQNRPEYWRGAVATRHGLDLRAFETPTRYQRSKTSFWRRLFGFNR
jgi:hypothetical protein